MGNDRDRARLRKALHEPIMPYFAGAYTTLMSIVQGAALATLIYVVFNSRVSKAIAIKGIINLLVIGIVWHLYITHIQLLSWRLTPYDTLIPMGFAGLECWIIFSIPRSIAEFSLLLAGIAIWGFVTFLNLKLHWKPKAEQLLEEHFEDKILAHELFVQTAKFHNTALISMLVITAPCIIVAAATYYRVLGEEAATFLIGVLSIIGFVVLFFGLDLRRSLNKSTALKTRIGNDGL